MLMELLLFLSFYLVESHRKTSVLLFVDTRFINDSHYEFGKMFVTRIALSHAFKKINKNVTEQLSSNSVSAQISSLWT